MVKAFSQAAAALCAAVLLFVGCDQSDISAPVVFDATLDPSNVYEVGQPIRFNFTGNAENITFFSGEVGHQYRFKDRYEVPVEDVISARLVMNVLVQYSYAFAPGSAMELYKSNTYDGAVTGTDFQADSLYARKILAEGLKDWKLIDTIPNAQLNNSPSRQMYWAEKEFTIEPEEVTNLSFFVWFHPKSRNLSIRKKVFMAGDIYVEMKDVPTQKYNFRTLDWKHFFMASNPLVIDPYAVTTWSVYTGGVLFDFAQKSEIVFQGGCYSTASGDVYECEIAAFTSPVSLNGVNPDTGFNVKNLMEHKTFYDYKFSKPGTYTVTFEATNASHLGMSRTSKSLEVTIKDKD